MFASKDALIANAGGGYPINNSLRFRSSASAYLSKTFAGGPTSTTIQTFSFWVKRGALGTVQVIISGYDGTSFSASYLYFDTDNTLALDLAGAALNIQKTTAVFRDPSAWYHIVLKLDTTNATAANRAIVYVNGVQQTLSGTTVSGAGQFLRANANNKIATYWSNASSFFGGYMAEINVIDGQALTPSSFGATGPNGVWQPIQYTGTYGTNGFYLPFSDTSALTTSSNVGLGKDFSGNANYWTTNNISITAGTTYDAMKDSPTLTSATVANFAVLNPLSNSVASTVLSGGNLNFVNYGSTYYASTGTTFYVSSGKWYFEAVMSGSGTASDTVGVHNGTAYTASVGSSSAYQTQAGSVGYTSDTGTITLSSVTQSTGATWTYGDIIGVAFDMGAGTVQFYKNGTATGSLVTGISGSYTPAFCINYYVSSTLSINFGQRPFSYTPPSGFVALNAYNIAAGTVTTSGSFTGNALADGPFVWLNGTPTAMTINGNAVTFGTNADKLANGFKVRTSSTSYNSTGSNTYSVSTTGAQFKYQIAQGNP